MTNEKKLVRDSMERSCTFLEANLTIDQAVKKLDISKLDYGVVVNGSGNAIGLVTLGFLTRYKDFSASLEFIPELIAIIVNEDTLLDEIIWHLDQTIIDHPELEGLVVEDEEERICGVLPRKVILSHALEMPFGLERGSDSNELAGTPQIRAKYFACPTDQSHLKRLVPRYDPNNPPKCPVHKIPLIRQP